MTARKSLQNVSEQLAVISEDLVIVDRMIDLKHDDVAAEVLGEASMRVRRLLKLVDEELAAE